MRIIMSRLAPGVHQLEAKHKVRVAGGVGRRAQGAAEQAVAWASRGGGRSEYLPAPGLLDTIA